MHSQFFAINFVGNKKFMAEIRGDRRCGNSTRQVDEWVQSLFDKGVVYIRDHAHKEDRKGGATNLAQEHSLGVLFRRLDMEHRLKRGRDVIYDPNTNRLSFIDA